MFNKIIFLILSFMLFLVMACFAESNPFISSVNTEKKFHSSSIKTVKYPIMLQKIFYRIAPIQKKLQRALSISIRRFKNEPSSSSMLILIFIAFIFGIIHAIGPGHGKTILFSYFLSNRTLFIKGVVFSTIIAFMHALSSLFIIVIINLIFKTSYLASFENVSNKIQLVSYLIIIIIGIFLLIKSMVNIFKPKQKLFSSKNENNFKFIPLALAVGFIPCPGALIILLFSLSLDILPLGIIMVLVMAMGMSVTIIFSSMFGLLLENKISDLIAHKQKIASTITSIIHVIGSIILILFAFFMLTPYL